uniref:ANK_REP_REGION domain-containing protein n=1 Tax=Caenorhabditis tropicalis TaxID=1561998 RepID=A0A1I7U441_9PELO
MESNSEGSSTPQEEEVVPMEATEAAGPSEPKLLAKRKGVDLILEANNDWKIQEIGFDGVERYLQPETFTDYVGKLARRVEWMKLVDSKSPYENSKVEPEEDEDERLAQVGKHGTNVELVTPESGPWSSVAKYLHESLNQLNILLDDMCVMKSTDYMKALTVLDPITVQEPTPEYINTNRGTQWIWKRRALQEAVQVLDIAQKQRQRAMSNLGLSVEYIAHLQRTKFFEELREMREIWRVRKTGDYIYGDLGYHIFGWKYDTPHIFDISRRTLCSKFETSNLSIIEVSVPKDLARRSMLCVTIVRDDVDAGQLIRDPEEAAKYAYSFREVDAEKIKELHWKDSLKWAQNTLILRDTFNNLCKEAIQLRNSPSIIRDNVMMIRLFDEYMLRFELQWFPFQPGELKEEGDVYLNRVLREMIIGFQCTKFVRPQFFCSMPVTHLPESLDLRGCQAYDTKEIEDRAVRPRAILTRMINVASHRALTTMVTDVAERVCRPNLDPTVQYKWLHCGRESSTMMFVMTSKDYEQYMGNVRNVFFAHVSCEGVEIETKEGVRLKCDRDAARVLYACQYVVCCYSVTMVSIISRNQWMTPFQVMYANVYALDEKGDPAPNIILCNQAATRSVLFVFHVGADPEISIRRFVVNEETAKPEEHQWKRLNYAKLYGTTLCKKIDALLSYIRDC